jgi:hypothetical protein
MKKLLKMIAAAIVASTSIELSAAAAENAQKLSGSQIRAKFTGMQLTDEVHWRYVYDRDGTLRGYSMGTKKVGKWAVEKDELCLYLEEPDGTVLVIMIVTGIVLAMHYVPTVGGAFNSVEHIMRDVNSGWLIRYVHTAGASMFFAVVYNPYLSRTLLRVIQGAARTAHVCGCKTAGGNLAVPEPNRRRVLFPAFPGSAAARRQVRAPAATPV